MKRATKYKNLICFAVVLIVLISISAIPAYAEFPPLTTAGRRLGSWILSGLTALNIAVTSTVSTSQGADIINFLADPLDVTYSYTEMWEDKPTIQIWDEYTTIDGVTYTDIWLSNEAAQKFKTDGLDFATAYSIASNTNGTFASGEGYYDGIPLFNISGTPRSQIIKVPFATGNYQLSENTYAENTWHSTGYMRVTEKDNNGASQLCVNGMPATNFPVEFQFSSNSYLSQGGWSYRTKNGYWYNALAGVPSRFINQPFDFDWVAGSIDPAPLAPDEGIMIRVPSNTPGLPTFIQDNPYLTEPTEIDVNLDPDIIGKLDDLIDIIAPILINLDSHDVQYTTNHEAPAPVPDTPIVDATVTEVTQPIINEITNYGDQITQQIPNIIESIPHIDEICNNIDTAPYHDLDTGLDHLPSVFLPFIVDLRSALGIWHYVTEWIAQISTTFSFVSGCLVGTSIMTPIYAAIAGFMCIKVYRRMTG